MMPGYEPMPTNPPPASDATPTPGAGGARDVDALEKLARFATPGPWHVQGVGIGGIEDTAGNVIAQAQQFKPVRNRDDLNDRIQNAAFIAAANPATVLALIAHLRAVEARNVDLWAVIDKLTADGCRAVTALIACEAERDAMRAAVLDMGLVGQGLYYAACNCDPHPAPALRCARCKAIEQLNRVVALARGPAAGETTDGGGKD
jgi:hypothetical protein